MFRDTKNQDVLFYAKNRFLTLLQSILTFSILLFAGILISGSPGTGKTAFILQLVEYSCFGRKRNYEYEELREQSDIREILPEELTAGMFTQLASHVVAYHFCQVSNPVPSFLSS